MPSQRARDWDLDFEALAYPTFEGVYGAHEHWLRVNVTRAFDLLQRWAQLHPRALADAQEGRAWPTLEAPR